MRKMPGSTRKRRDSRYRKAAAARDEVLRSGETWWACPDCGKATFTTRDAARQFARRHYPDAELSPYLAAACDGKSFHLTSQDARERQAWRDVQRS